MKKVSVVFTVIHCPPHVVRFVIRMAQANAWMLQAVFVHDDPSEQTEYPFPNDLRLTEDNIPAEMQQEDTLEHIDSQIFARACTDADINYEIRKNVSLKQLLADSSSSDLMVIDKRMEFYTFSFEDLLQSTKCPVCLVSSGTAPIENVIMAYDGSDSARYAIDSFLVLFSGLNSLSAYLVSVNSDNEKLNRDEFVQSIPTNNFGSFITVSLAGNPKQELAGFVKKYVHNAIVVAGAFGRNLFSHLVHPSVGKEVLSRTAASLFIAHK